MKMLYYALFLLLPLTALSEDLIKVGSYDFNQLLEQMGEEPKLREKIPDALREPLFLTLMLNTQILNLRSKPAPNTVWNAKIQEYTQRFTLESLLKNKQQKAQRAQKSGKMQDLVILGLTLADKYQGFNIILKPENYVLYSKTDLNKNIATILADYNEEVKKEEPQEEL